MSKGFQRDELTPQEAKFAGLIAGGMTQSDAYREVFQVDPDAKPEGIYSSASYKAKLPRIQVRVRELIADARLHDILSPQQWFLSLMDDLQTCRERGNMTAAISAQRLLGQALQTLREGTTVNVGGDVSDEALIERLTGGDPDKTKMLKGLLGQDDFSK